ncbi:CDP-alcohol phosphatidyltransferase [compost metagenome]
MNLHRTSGAPDWVNVKVADRNVFQNVAAATGGILSPANVITVIGLGLVMYGLLVIMQQEFWMGLVFLAVGRLLDIVDGLVAEATYTKSPLGELFDAVADKIGTLFTIAVLLIAGVTHWWVIMMLIVPQIAIALLILYKKSKGISVHPSRQGKLSMAAAWIGIVGLLLAKALGNPAILTFAVYGIIASSVVLGFYALWQYATDRN